MKVFLGLLVGSICLAVATHADAIPTAYYNPTTGHIFLENDFGNLAIVNLESLSGRLNGMPNHFYFGPVVDEAPYYLTYFGVPATNTGDPPELSHLHDLGPVVLDGGSVGDIRLYYLGTLAIGFLDGKVVQIPEPTSIFLTSTVGLFWLFMNRAMTPRKSHCTSYRDA
jgi:hypothetical protein